MYISYFSISRFVPEYVTSNKDEEQNKKELVKLNGELVQRLQAGENGSLYTKVMTESETVAVGVGMIKPGSDLDEVVDLIWATGKELEDSSKVRGQSIKMLIHRLRKYVLRISPSVSNNVAVFQIKTYMIRSKIWHINNAIVKSFTKC